MFKEAPVRQLAWREFSIFLSVEAMVNERSQLFCVVMHRLALFLHTWNNTTSRDHLINSLLSILAGNLWHVQTPLFQSRRKCFQLFFAFTLFLRSTLRHPIYSSNTTFHVAQRHSIHSSFICQIHLDKMKGTKNLGKISVRNNDCPSHLPRRLMQLNIGKRLKRTSTIMK